MSYKCKKCFNKICKVTFIYGSGLCGHCSHINKIRPKHSKRMLGKNNPNFKHGKRSKAFIYRCIDCNIKINSRTKRCKICRYKYHAKIMRGKKNYFYGRIPKPKFGKYKNITMRSSWEIKFAKYLDKNNIKWLYESRRFDLKNTTYTPDFYLPVEDKYIEIKGYFSPLFKNKLKKFKKLFSNINILVLTKKELKTMEVI